MNSFLFRHPGDFRAVFSLPLNASIRNLNYLRAKNMDSHLLVPPAIFKPGSMVLKPLDSRLNFGNDERGVTSEWFYHPQVPHSRVSLPGIQTMGGDIPMITNRRTKRRSKNVDSR